MDNKLLGVVALTTLVVAIIASIATVSITGNYIWVNKQVTGTNRVYTVNDIDRMFANHTIDVLKVLNHCSISRGTTGLTNINGFVVGTPNMNSGDEICGVGNYCIAGFLGSEDLATEKHALESPIGCGDFGSITDRKELAYICCNPNK